ncbi:MAG: hypothetical protein HRU12_20685, partial [Phaeodactylibacter sp.]|nr:hypothetical protein [Phaeodactylibacter sp.]
YTAWLDAIAVEPNLTEKLPAMQSHPEYAVLNTIQTFGAPYPLSEGSTNPSEIPVFWILGGVLGLVLTGLWVRR